MTEASSSPPPPPPSAGVAAGWYPQGAVQRYWDGSSWTDHTAPLAAAAAPPQPVYAAPQPVYAQAPAPVVVVANNGPRSAVHSGMTNGQHLKHLALSILTCGAWLPVWWFISWSSKKKTTYH